MTAVQAALFPQPKLRPAKTAYVEVNEVLLFATGRADRWLSYLAKQPQRCELVDVCIAGGMWRVHCATRPEANELRDLFIELGGMPRQALKVGLFSESDQRHSAQPGTDPTNEEPR